MISFTINLEVISREVMSRVGEWQNEIFRGLFETKRSDTTLVKTSDSKID